MQRRSCTGCGKIKKQRANELRWFGDRTTIPHSIHKRISLVELNAFKLMVHNHPHTEKLPDLDMLPAELARICSRRYLSDLHMSWVADKLNALQDDSYVIFLKFITDIELFCRRKILSREKRPTNLVFMIHIKSILSPIL